MDPYEGLRYTNKEKVKIDINTNDLTGSCLFIKVNDEYKNKNSKNLSPQHLKSQLSRKIGETLENNVSVISK